MAQTQFENLVQQATLAGRVISVHHVGGAAPWVIYEGAFVDEDPTIAVAFGTQAHATLEAAADDLLNLVARCGWGPL